jgi:GNAT superfamily N-acetyltransferase
MRTIAAASYQHYVSRIGHAPAPMTADYPQAVRCRQAWVAVEGGEVIGFAILIAQPGYLLLDNVAVRPDARGRGIGARLLDLAEDHARSLHLGEARLYTNEAMTENLSYYPGMGTSRPTGPSKTASAVCTSANRWTDPRFLVTRESHMCAGH